MKNQWPLEKEKTGFDPLGEYDRLMGEKCREASAWRFRTLLTMVANIILLVITGVSVTANRTVPVFIMENELGELTYLGTYSKDYAAGKVTEKMIDGIKVRVIGEITEDIENISFNNRTVIQRNFNAVI